jgi:peptidoglycan hydrolase CwlO-like protein
VNSCLKDSRAQYRKEIDPIRAQEVELHEVQRKLRASIKDQRDAAKIAERASAEKAAERAANQKEFEEKQKAAAARAADLEQRRKDAPKRAQENKAGTQLD